ncbi:MAG: hypothetical protein AB7L70_19285 [Pyrinomonadaceae bacterium]
MRTDQRHCFECSDLGFTVEQNAKRLCWRRHFDGHAAANDAAGILERAVDRLMVRKIQIDHHAFEIAKVLTRYTTDRPFDKGDLLTAHLSMSLRSFQHIIEDLRKVWLLPVGSRKEPPSGYWIITDQTDFAEWVTRAKSAPITQLSTIHAVARRNFPVFAEQLELEFWQDMHGSDTVRQMKEAA